MAGGLDLLLCVLMLVCLKTVQCQRQCEWKTCRECIRDPSLCMWCSAEDFKGSRCQPVSNKADNWCPLVHIQNPEGNSSVTESKEFSSEAGNIIQLKPKRYKIDLRVGQEQKFTFSYKATKHFPVDVYFLLDASTSMELIKKDLFNQSFTIFDTMTKLTKDVFMGLGSFIDKNVVPFTNNVTAQKSYSFKHHLSLTDNITGFKDVLEHFVFGINSDNPEAGLEGIAQAIACKHEINWRNQSRKILVYMTDESYHSAGDGKAAGIVTPYDGGCYLNASGFYSKEKEFDYPSVGIINNMATKEQIKILFVSNCKDQTVYTTLQDAISDSEATEYDTGTISRVLKDTYEKITQDVKLQVNLPAAEKDYLEITFDPKCDMEFASNCNVTAGEEKNFKGRILLKKYSNKDHFTIDINPKGLHEKIVLDVNVFSDCGCAKDVVINSTKCNNIGNRICGVCECPDAISGPNCECNSNSALCSPPNSTQECSGHGLCNSCGICQCADGFTGTYCEDQTNNCPLDNHKKLCSAHGTCLNGICNCYKEWTGAACECTTSKRTCINDGMECNNRGYCVCGACKCNTPEIWDARAIDQYNYCARTKCYNCNSQQCRHLIPCIHCIHEGGSCSDKCGDTLIRLQDPSGINDESKWQNCTHIQFDFGCYSDFKYIYNDNNTMTLVVLNTNCSQSQMFILIISVLILVGIGLATLVAWKLLTNARDRREYEAFLRSSQGGDSIRINPTYTAPSTTYVNPAFQKN